MGGAKVNFPLRTLKKIKSFLLRFLWHLAHFFYFLFEDTLKYSILTKFQKFLSIFILKSKFRFFQKMGKK